MNAKWIKEKRIVKKLSQKQLAELIGVSVQSVSNYESGIQYPRPQVMDKIIKSIGQEEITCVSDKVMQDIERLSKGLCDYIKKNFDPYTSIVVDDTGVKVLSCSIFIPNS